MIALADLARQGGVIEGQEGARLVTLAEISERQGISLSYLEQLFVKLRRADIVSSVRGPGGGYRLSHDPSRLRIIDILGAVDEEMDALKQGAGASGVEDTDVVALTDKLWERLSAHVYVFLHQTRLSDIVGDQLAPCPAVPTFIELVDET